MNRVGVDVGGTFTDLILTDDATGRVMTYKVASTPQDQSIGVMQGIQELCNLAAMPLADISQVLHGTTVATNIMIEKSGATVGMITTRNYRDILHIARHKKVENFSIQQDLPWQSNPLVKRRYRLTVTEKLAAPDGQVKLKLNEAEVRAAAVRLKEARVDTVIICLLFAFLNDTHEQRAKDIVQEVWPEALVYTSSEVVPQIREYERFSTTAVNAYIAPRVIQYVNNLQGRLHDLGLRGELLLQSYGGVASARAVCSKPVTLLKSGPAGGVLAAAWWGELEQISNLISIDIGGTSADISVLPNLKPRIINARDAQVSGYAVMIPMIDVETIGAGGGSIAYLDAGGAFRVGPRSAGADPGPACYGKGGNDPCVTDAHVVLGRLDAESFLGGEMQLDQTLSQEAVARQIADALHLSVAEAAAGIIKVINNNMALAIRASSVRKGIDPREYTLFTAGGAGPLHAVELADLIGAARVVVPNYPGITAAVGLLVGDLQYEYMRSQPVRLDQVDLSHIDELNHTLEALEAQAREDLTADGIRPDLMAFERVADCRYVGQGFELRTPIPSGKLDHASVSELIQTFHHTHKIEYDHDFETNPVEIVTLRVIGIGKTAPFELPRLNRGGRQNPEAAITARKPTYFEVNGELTLYDSPRYRRSELLAADRLDGPAIITQRDSTTIIPPHWMATVSDHGSLILQRMF
jgi:N-methylhydantoinase A